MMWNLDCFIESNVQFAVNSYSYESIENALLAAHDVLLCNQITGIYAVDIYSSNAQIKRRFYAAKDVKLFLTYL